MNEVERCARALHQRDVDDPAMEPDQREWDRLAVALQDQYRADAKAVLDAANHQGAVGGADRLRGGLRAALEYLELVPDDSVDYEAALIRVRAALDGQG
jgi:hypothetical protein